MFNLANKLTLLRMLLVPLVIVLLYFEGPVTCVLATLAFIAASITDWADGYVARRNNMVTSMGKFLDPQAWVVILIVCRELVVTGLRAIAIDEGIVLAADRYGKLKTVLQIAAIIPMLLHYPYWGVRLWPIGEIILYLALIMSVVSCVNYCYGFYRKVAAKNAAE